MLGTTPDVVRATISSSKGNEKKKKEEEEENGTKEKAN